MALPRTLWFGSKPGNYASIQPRQPATAAASHLVRREQSGSPDLPGYVPRVGQTVLLVILRPTAVSHDSKTARPAKSGAAVASSADTLRHSPVAGKTVYTDLYRPLGPDASNIPLAQSMRSNLPRGQCEPYSVLVDLCGNVSRETDGKLSPHGLGYRM
jgi:hypothetical protein